MGESAVDLVIRAYGNIEALVPFLRDNDLTADHVETAAATREVDDALRLEMRELKTVFAPRVTPRQQKVVVSNGQNLVDLCLQELGSVEGLVAFMRSNGFVPNTNPTPGAEVKTLSEDILNEEVRAFYRGLNYRVNTGKPAGEVNQGIGWMIIEDTFIVD
jgi:hypothetical protein